MRFAEGAACLLIAERRDRVPITAMETLHSLVTRADSSSINTRFRWRRVRESKGWGRAIKEAGIFDIFRESCVSIRNTSRRKMFNGWNAFFDIFEHFHVICMEDDYDDLTLCDLMWLYDLSFSLPFFLFFLNIKFLWTNILSIVLRRNCSLNLIRL